MHVLTIYLGIFTALFRYLCSTHCCAIWASNGNCTKRKRFFGASSSSVQNKSSTILWQRCATASNSNVLHHGLNPAPTEVHRNTQLECIHERGCSRWRRKSGLGPSLFWVRRIGSLVFKGWRETAARGDKVVKLKFYLKLHVSDPRCGRGWWPSLAVTPPSRYVLWGDFR